MDARHKPFRVEDSEVRIRDILDGPAEFDERDSIPDSGALTYQNGYYVKCTAIFIDIRGSSALKQRYPQRRTLGKLYRAYVSECVAVLNGHDRCRQVFIQGDCVSAVFDTPDRASVNEVFPLVGQLNSVVQLLNFRLERRGWGAITVGIGIDTGRALMLKAGFSGSGINDLIWMGDVLNRASHLCHSANKSGRQVIQVSADVQALLDQPRLIRGGGTFLTHGLGLLNFDPDSYECDVVDSGMADHLERLRAQVSDRGLIASMLSRGTAQTLLGGQTSSPGLSTARTLLGMTDAVSRDFNPLVAAALLKRNG